VAETYGSSHVSKSIGLCNKQGGKFLGEEDRGEQKKRVSQRSGVFVSNWGGVIQGRAGIRVRGERDGVEG